MKLLELVNNKNYIAGKWLDFPETIKVVNPAKNQPIGTVPKMDLAHIKMAIDSTCQGFEIWSKTSKDVRIRFLQRWHQLIMANLEELTHLIAIEQGKVLADAKREISYGASYIEWFTGILSELEDKIRPDTNYNIISKFEAIGPVAAITPWNFPNAMITRKLAPALAAGCSVILKPSEFTPFSALVLAKLAEEAGLPANVLNIVTTNAEIFGQEICEDFRIRKISFTGSTRVGKILYQNSSKDLKKLSLELGGNAPFIVFANCDIDKTVDDLIIAKQRSCGQSCISPNRILIEEKIYQEFIDKLTIKVAALKIGDPLDPQNDLGPLINQAAIDKIGKLLTDAVVKGAEINIGSQINGNFITPTVISNCNKTMDIFKIEIFGPVFACYKFKNEEEAVSLANESEYGLQAYLYSNDQELNRKICDKLNFNMVAINLPLPSNAKAPFGGRKASGFGTEGSKFGIYEYLNIKYIAEK